MPRCLVKLWNDESGFILSAELVLISTILVLGLIVGLTTLQSSVVGELTDVSGAIRSLNQSYYYKGYSGRSLWGWCGIKSRTYGSAFVDRNSGDVVANEEIVGNCYMATPAPKTEVVPPAKVVPCPEGIPCDKAPATPQGPVLPPCSTCDPLPPGTKLEPMPDSRTLPAPGAAPSTPTPVEKPPKSEPGNEATKERKPPKKVVPEAN